MTPLFAIKNISKNAPSKLQKLFYTSMKMIRWQRINRCKGRLTVCSARATPFPLIRTRRSKPQDCLYFSFAFHAYTIGHTIQFIWELLTPHNLLWDYCTSCAVMMLLDSQATYIAVYLDSSVLERAAVIERAAVAGPVDRGTRSGPVPADVPTCWVTDFPSFFLFLVYL